MQAAMSEPCPVCSGARRFDVFAFRLVRQRARFRARFSPSPAREVHPVEFHIKFARFFDNRVMANRFGFSASRVLDSEEHIPLDRLSRPWIRDLKFCDLFDLLLSKFDRLAVM